MLGCIVYQTPFDTALHHTWFDLFIGKAGPDGKFKFIEPGDQKIEGDQLKLEWSVFGLNDAD